MEDSMNQMLCYRMKSLWLGCCMNNNEFLFVMELCGQTLRKLILALVEFYNFSRFQDFLALPSSVLSSRLALSFALFNSAMEQSS